MKRSMLRLVLVAVGLTATGTAVAQSPYPHRSFAEKFDCRPTALPQFVGLSPNVDVARQLLTSSGAKKLRWLQAGQSAGNGKKGRVTAQLDAQGKIATAFCG